MVLAVAGASETISLRITLRYKTLDELVERYAENVSSAGLFLRTRAPKAAGTKIRFELLLADGSRALRGEGVVVQIRADDKPGMALRFNVLDAESQELVDRIVKEHGEGQLAPTPLSTPFTAPKRKASERSASGWRARSRSGWTSGGTSAATPGAMGGRVLPARPARATSEGRPVLPRHRSSISRPWADGPASKTVPGLSGSDKSGEDSDRTLRLDTERLGNTEAPKPSSSEIIVEDPSLLPQPVSITKPAAPDTAEPEEILAPPPRAGVDEQTQLVEARGPDGFPVATPIAQDIPPAASTSDDVVPSADLAELAEAVVATASEVAARPPSMVGFRPMIREASVDTATVRPEEPAISDPVVESPLEAQPDAPFEEEPTALAGAEHTIAGPSEDVGPETAVIESPLHNDAHSEDFLLLTPDEPAPLAESAEPEAEGLLSDDNVLPQAIPEHLDAPWNPSPEHLAYRTPTSQQTATETPLKPEADIAEADAAETAAHAEGADDDTNDVTSTDTASDTQDMTASEAWLDAALNPDTDSLPAETDQNLASEPTPNFLAEATEADVAEAPPAEDEDEEFDAAMHARWDDGVDEAPAANVQAEQEPAEADEPAEETVAEIALARPTPAAEEEAEETVAEIALPKAAAPFPAAVAEEPAEETVVANAEPATASEDLVDIASADIESQTNPEPAVAASSVTVDDAEEAAPGFFPAEEETLAAQPSEVFPPPPDLADLAPEIPEMQPAAHRHDFEARTEIIRAERPDAKYSTQVQVVGLSVDGEIPKTSIHPSRTPALRARPIVERSGLSGDPKNMLEKARKAAFSEESTEVPPERDNVTHHVRTRGPGRIQARNRAQAAGRPVGLDLGQRWARVGYLEQGELQLQPLAGSAYVPALVGFDDERVLIGIKALGLQRQKPEQTAWVHELLNVEKSERYAGGRGENAKIQLGDDVQEVESLLRPFFGRLLRSASHPETGRARAMVLWSQHTEAAKKRLQRVLDDGGTEVVRFVEPMEAAIAAFNLNERPVEHFLLVDVGASHLEVHVASRNKDKTLSCVRSAYSNELSAHRIDDDIAGLALGVHFNDGGPDHRDDSSARGRVLEVVEAMRPELGRMTNVELKVSLPSGSSGAHLEREINVPRVDVYQHTEGTVAEICKFTQETLRKAGVDPRKLGTVLISGSGGSYPPLLDAMRALTQTEPILGPPPAQVLTLGLARLGIQAERAEHAQRDDALTASIGIELPGGRLGVLLRTGIELPANVTRRIPTTRDNQTSMELKLFQGDTEYVASCKSLGRVNLDNIPKGLRGEVDIELMASVDRQGVLTVRLTEASSSATGDLVLPTAQTPERRKDALLTSDLERPQQKKKAGLFRRFLGLDT